jgi:hypothetical protein
MKTKKTKTTTKIKNTSTFGFLFLLFLVIGLFGLSGYLGWQLRSIKVDKIGNRLHENTFVKYAREDVQNVTFYAQHSAESSKGIARKGIVFRKPGARATVLICHGFMCDKTDVRFLRMIFSNYNVMIFDFRAHGECPSEQCCTFGCNEVYDIKAAAGFIKSDNELGKLPLVAYGFSMGAVSSINAQSQDEKLFDCAIWDCPFDSTEGVIARSIENLKITLFGYTFPLPGRAFLKKYAYNSYVQALLKGLLKTVAQADASAINTYMMPLDTVKAVEKVSIPAFFITCRKDDKAPPEVVRKVYNAATGYKRFWITNGRRHFDSFFHNPEKYAYKINGFIEKFLDNRLVGKLQFREYQDAVGD